MAKPKFMKYLSRDRIVRLNGGTRAAVFTELIDYVARERGVDAEDVFAAVMAREKVMSTAVGGGLAIPHGRLAGFGQPMVVLGICRENIGDYASLDGSPVRLVLLVLVDYMDFELHLQLLSSVAGTFLTNQALVDDLMKCLDDPDEVMRRLESGTK